MYIPRAVPIGVWGPVALGHGAPCCSQCGRGVGRGGGRGGGHFGVSIRISDPYALVQPVVQATGGGGVPQSHLRVGVVPPLPWLTAPLGGGGDLGQLAHMGGPEV